MADRDLIAADPMCPVCECAIVDDLAHIDHSHLGEVAVHGECLPTDMMLDAIRSERREAAGWQRLTQQWRDIARDRRNELYAMYAVLEHALARIAELEQRKPVGYITGYRTAEGDWSIEFDGAPFTTREEARADLVDAIEHCLPDLICRTLTVYDEEI